MGIGPHVSARRARASLRELARELWITRSPQPLLPLFYLYRQPHGRAVCDPATTGKGAREAAGPPVVFVHGYMQNRVGLRRARARARAAGRGPLFGFNYPWFSVDRANAERLDRYVARVCKETGSAAVDLVCHSMGGLIAMEMMRDEARRETLKVRRCVTIATPHAGVAWPGPLLGVGRGELAARLEAPRGARRSPYRRCRVCPSTRRTTTSFTPRRARRWRIRGGRDIEIEGPAHLAILFSPRGRRPRGVVPRGAGSGIVLAPCPKPPRAAPRRRFARSSARIELPQPAPTSSVVEADGARRAVVDAIVAKAREAQASGRRSPCQARQGDRAR